MWPPSVMLTSFYGSTSLSTSGMVVTRSGSPGALRADLAPPGGRKRALRPLWATLSLSLACRCMLTRGRSCHGSPTNGIFMLSRVFGARISVTPSTASSSKLWKIPPPSPITPLMWLAPRSKFRMATLLPHGVKLLIRPLMNISRG